MPNTFDQQGQQVQNQVNIGVMHGDIVYVRQELEAPLRALFEPLIAERSALFGGRIDALTALTQFMRQEKGGYLAVTAPAGFGKTSLMAALIRSAPDAFAYHFFTPLYGDRSLTEAFFLRNVVQQMAQWHGQSEDVPVALDKLTALYHHLLDLPLDQTRVLLLDGLDEVTRWSLRPYLGRRLPPRVHIIATLRDVGQDWRKDFGFPPDQLTEWVLGGLLPADIEAVLRVAGATLDDPALISAIARVAATDPAQPQQGADPFYVRFLAADLAAGRMSPADLAQLPTGLESYLDGWWQALRAQAGDAPTRDLFGTLTAALGRLGRDDLEALNPSLQDAWAGDQFDSVLTSVRRFVMGDDASGYALVHPRLQAYLRDPRRIKAMPLYRDKLLAYCADWASHRSPYALSHAIDHFAQADDLTRLFATIGDGAFREAQQQVLGDSQPTLDDLKLALGLALDHDRWLETVALVAAYRDSLRNQTLTQRLFDALQLGNSAEALRLAEQYVPVPGWPHAVLLFVALEAAALGDQAVAEQAIAAAKKRPVGRLAVLSEALISAVARLLAVQCGVDAKRWISAEVPALAQRDLLAEYPIAPPLPLDQQTDLIARLMPQLEQFEMLAEAGESEAVISVMPFLEQGTRSGWVYEDDMGALLRQLAVDATGWELIERTLKTVLPNPYLAYRDIGLQMVLRAALAAPLTSDPMALMWLRHVWQELASVVMNREGIIFTYELPFLLLSEAERRDVDVDPALASFCDHALGIFDKWGTRMRVHAAYATTAFRAGNSADADGTIGWLGAESHGYAGFETQNLIMLGNRWLAFGTPERIHQPLSQWEATTLVEKLNARVAAVEDADFRQELTDLVAQAMAWWQQTGVDSAEALAQLARLPTASVRMAYVDYISAVWSAAGDRKALKALLPLVLDDSTLTDLVLARLLALTIAEVDDAALAQMQQTVAIEWQT